MNTLYTDSISAYTREQALQIGLLKDITEYAKRNDIKHHTAVTNTVWDYMIDNEEIKNQRQMELKIRDICFMLDTVSKRNTHKIDTLTFPVIRMCNSHYMAVTLKATISVGDNLEPVITIMFPDED